MITISYIDYYDELILECVGHAESGPYGCDIICSALSILCITVKEYLKKAQEEGLISSLRCDVSSGYANISFRAEKGSEAEKCFEAILSGFRILACAFPDYIEFDN